MIACPVTKMEVNMAVQQTILQMASHMQQEDGIAEASVPMGRLHQALRQRLNGTVARVHRSCQYICIIYQYNISL